MSNWLTRLLNALGWYRWYVCEDIMPNGDLILVMAKNYRVLSIWCKSKGMVLTAARYIRPWFRVKP
jgi:hypothetical protein